jgi:hypothetical protein
MFDVYKNENEDFLKHLFETPDKSLQYKELVQALKDVFVIKGTELMFAQVDTNIPFIDD